MNSIKQIIRKLLNSDSKCSDLLSFCVSRMMHPHFLKHFKVFYKNQGKLVIRGTLNFGVFSNRLGLDPGARGVLRIYKGGLFLSEDKVRIARDCKVYVAGNLTIGEGTYINPNTMIVAKNSVSIGKECAISWNCQIIDDDMHSFVIDGEIMRSSRPIVIGDHVWIGSNVTILKGVTVGDNSVIASGSTVTKDVPASSLFAGTPAKLLRESVQWK